MHPVFVVGTRIAFVKDIYHSGVNIEIDPMRLLTKRGFFIPTERRSFTIEEYYARGWRNVLMKGNVDTVSAMMFDVNGTLKYVELVQVPDDNSSRNLNDMIAVSEDKSTVYNRSFNDKGWEIDEVIIPYGGSFKGAFSGSDHQTYMGTLALEIANGDLEGAIDAYVKGVSFGPVVYTIIDLKDVQAWLKENTRAVKPPRRWSYKVPVKKETQPNGTK